MHLLRALALTSALILGACNQQTASTPPPATSAPAAPTVSLTDFKGDWTGKSLANADLRLLVTDNVAFAYANFPQAMKAPHLRGQQNEGAVRLRRRLH